MLFCLFCIYGEATGVGWGARVREWGVGAHPIGGFGRRAFVDGTAAVSRSGLFELGQSEHLGDCWHDKCVSSAPNAFRSAEIRQAPKAILEIIIIIIIVIIIIIFVPGAYSIWILTFCYTLLYGAAMLTLWSMILYLRTSMQEFDAK